MTANRWALAAMIWVGFGGAARAGTPGTLVITAQPVDTSDKAFEAELKKAATQELFRRQSDSWTLNFVAFLKKAAGSKQVNLVFYDTAEKVHEPTQVFPISTQPTAKILVSNVSLGDDQGFKPNHTYNVLVTRLIGGKEDVYARATVSLK